MSASNSAFELFKAANGVTDPGNAGTISVDRSPGVCNLSSATAETRTLGRPTRQGCLLTLHFSTDGGDITLTITGGYNEDGDTTFTFSDEGQQLTLQSFITKAGVYFWRKISDYGLGNIAPADASVLDEFSAVTATAAELNKLDEDLASNVLQSGVGITAGVGTIIKTAIFKAGGVIVTQILIDLTGLNGGASAGDVIGTDGAGVAYLGQVTAAKMGTVLGGRMTCLETPAGSNVDVDLWSADEATLVEDVAISTASNEVQLINHGNWAAGETVAMILPPLVNQYLYLTSGAATSATFTAGIFLIEFFGY